VSLFIEGFLRKSALKGRVYERDIFLDYHLTLCEPPFLMSLCAGAASLANAKKICLANAKKI
jgi:hypothetical protein